MASSASTGEAKPSSIEMELQTDTSSNTAQTSEDGRNRWSSRWAFWLAAVGSAVGLGNLWRFPWQCATWGGGPFIFAYLLCLFTLGMPILTQELALGQKYRSGDIEAFGRMNWRLRGIGLASVFGVFGIITFYSVVIAMSLLFFFNSFQKTLPYSAEDPTWWATDVLIICSYPVDTKCGSEFAWELYLCTLVVFLLTYFCVWKGVLSASNVVKITMPLPLIFLLILLIRVSFLPGAGDGIKTYLDFSDWSSLEDSGIWDAAVGQCFFSLSVCMGVMTAYGSYNPINQNIAADEKLISMLDLCTSLFAGFVVYCVLGYLNHKQPTWDPPSGSTDSVAAVINSTMVMSNNSDVGYNTTWPPAPDWYTSASFGLVFSAYPIAITEMGDAPWEQIFAIIFFLTLFMLGIDSLFSMVEGLSTVVVDSDVGRQFNLSHQKVCAVICCGGALCSLLYCFGSGLYYLDIMDRYINNYGMVFLGACETLACGWFYGTERQINKVGTKAVEYYRIGFFITLILSIFIAFISTYDYFFIGIIVGIIGLSINYYIASLQIESELLNNLTLNDKLWYIAGWENTEELRDFINCNGDENWLQNKKLNGGEIRALYSHNLISIIWGFLIKYFIPTVLSIVLVATMKSDIEDPYSGYEWSDLSIGIIWFSLMVIVVFIIIIKPQLLKQTSDVTGMSPAGSPTGDNNNSKRFKGFKSDIIDGTGDEPIAPNNAINGIERVETVESINTNMAVNTDE